MLLFLLFLFELDLAGLAAIGTSLFVEGSHGETLKRTVVKSLVVIFSLPVPAAALLYVCGGWVPGMVGAEYAWRWLRGAAGDGCGEFVCRDQVYFTIKRGRMSSGEGVGL